MGKTFGIGISGEKLKIENPVKWRASSVQVWRSEIQSNPIQSPLRPDAPVEVGPARVLGAADVPHLFQRLQQPAKIEWNKNFSNKKLAEKM